MLSMLLMVLLIALVAWVCMVLVERTGVPHPFGMIAKIIIVVLAVVFILERTGLLNSSALG